MGQSQNSRNSANVYLQVTFFPLQFMAFALRTLAINSSGKNCDRKTLLRNFQYGPPTQVVRAINELDINSLAQLACPDLFSTEVTNTKKPANDKKARNLQESPQSQASW